MKAVFIIDVDKDELGEAVATITSKENDITFFARGVIRPLPETKDVGYPNDDYTVGFGDGWDACIDAIKGETE